MAISEITDAKKCCGCGVCESVCPKNCITMKANDEGFLYPVIDGTNCIECGLCIKSCPINVCPESANKDFEREVYACRNKNSEIRYKSSSGGFFYELAKYVLDQNGIVFGVIYKELKAIYAFAETEEELIPMLGSKYVQSYKNGIWSRIKKEVLSGRKVLFSGTPCEVGALRSYLKRDYDNLICVDFICMGTPSPAMFTWHLRDLEKKYKSKITSMSCRSKKYGAYTHSLLLDFENGKQYFRAQYAEPYIKSFHSRLYLRKSCHDCSYKKEKRESDFTMADFWGLQFSGIPMSVDGGVSMLIVQSEKAKKILDLLKSKFEMYPTTMEIALKMQPMMTSSCSPEERREEFFNDCKINSNKKFSQVINKYIPVTAKDILRSRLKQVDFLRNLVQKNR